jgi:predicted DNA-binding antitoxin AbrB/MazE fold protein
MEIQIKSGQHLKLLLSSKMAEVGHELKEKLSRNAAKKIVLTTQKTPIVQIPDGSRVVVIIKSKDEEDQQKSANALEQIHTQLTERVRGTENALELIAKLSD